MKYLAYALFVTAFIEANYGVYLWSASETSKFFFLSMISFLSAIGVMVHEDLK